MRLTCKSLERLSSPLVTSVKKGFVTQRTLVRFLSRFPNVSRMQLGTALKEHQAQHLTGTLWRTESLLSTLYAGYALGLIANMQQQAGFDRL